MTGKDAVKTALGSTKEMLNWYLGDLSDADLLVRPVPEANHIAWQLGHLISAEVHLAKETLPEAVYPALPAGFDEQHGKATAAMEPPKGFKTKDEYLALFGKVREASLAALSKMSEADLDRPTKGNMAKFAPTVGALMVLMSNHVLMHAGQFSVVRRKLGKPVLF
jgi:DinB family protein